jgi:hypothetical protein
MRCALLFVAVILVGCAAYDSRLEGRWKSNRELTMASFTVRKFLSPAGRAKVSSIFGKLVLNYDRGTVIEEMPSSSGQPPWRHRSRYRVVAADSDSLVYVMAQGPFGKPLISYVHFDGPNRYWIYLGSSGTKEYFDRISP